MTHQQRIKAIRAQMKDALRSGDMCAYLSHLEGLSIALGKQAEPTSAVRVEHDLARGGW